MEKVMSAVNISASIMGSFQPWKYTTIPSETDQRMSGQDRPDLRQCHPLSERDLAELTAKDFIDVVRLHAEDGVDFVTLHCGIAEKQSIRLKT